MANRDPGETAVEGEGKLSDACPICDTSLPADAPKCPSCGFPTALLSEARDALASEPRPAAPASSAVPTPVTVSFGEGASPVPPVSAGALSMEQTAVALQAALKVAQLLGMDASEVAAAQTSAVMAAAGGNVGESQRILQDAYDKLEPETAQKFEALAVSLEEQEGRLREEGIAADVARELSRSRRDYDEGARIEAVEALLKAQKDLGELEQAWRLVKETLLRIDTLHEVGRRIGMDTSTVDERLVKVRQMLAEENLTARTLSEAGTEAGATLVLLHEQVRNQIAVLGQEAIRGLKAHPPSAEERPKAEARLRQVLAHARAGRLKEASDEMVDFRRTFLGAAEPAKKVAEEAAESASPAPLSPPVAAVAAPADPTVLAAAKEAEAAPPVVSPEPSPGPSPSTSAPEAKAPAEPAAAPTASGSKPEEAAPGPAAPAAAPAVKEPEAKPFKAPETAAPKGPEAKAPKEAEAKGPKGKAAAREPAVEAAAEAPSAKGAEAAATGGAPMALNDLIKEARALGAQLKTRQQAGKDVRVASAKLKELAALIKAGKRAEATAKLGEIRAALPEG